MFGTMVMGEKGSYQAQLQASLNEQRDGEGGYYSNTTAIQATDTHTCAPFSFSHVYTAKSHLVLKVLKSSFPLRKEKSSEEMAFKNFLLTGG